MGGEAHSLYVLHREKKTKRGKEAIIIGRWEDGVGDNPNDNSKS
jgi:hypothetical protein